MTFDGFDVMVIVALTAFIVFGAVTTYHTFKTAVDNNKGVK